MLKPEPCKRAYSSSKTALSLNPSIKTLFLFSGAILPALKGFEKYHAPAFFMISGLSLGSIITMFFNSEVMEVYRSWGAGASLGLDLGLGIGLLIVGLILSFLLVRYEKNKSKNVSQVK